MSYVTGKLGGKKLAYKLPGRAYWVVAVVTWMVECEIAPNKISAKAYSMWFQYTFESLGLRSS
jgi:hypothetical protein